MKSYTDIEQSKKLAEILPIESADITLPFRHTPKNEYVPEYAISRSYIDVYNEMITLPGMDKEEVCKLIQPCWGLAALFCVLPDTITSNDGIAFKLNIKKNIIEYSNPSLYLIYKSVKSDNPVDACYEMIIKLHKLNLL